MLHYLQHVTHLLVSKDYNREVTSSTHPYQGSNASGWCLGFIQELSSYSQLSRVFLWLQAVMPDLSGYYMEVVWSLSSDWHCCLAVVQDLAADSSSYAWSSSSCQALSGSCPPTLGCCPGFIWSLYSSLQLFSWNCLGVSESCPLTLDCHKGLSWSCLDSWLSSAVCELCVFVSDAGVVLWLPIDISCLGVVQKVPGVSMNCQRIALWLQIVNSCLWVVLSLSIVMRSCPGVSWSCLRIFLCCHLELSVVQQLSSDSEPEYLHIDDNGTNDVNQLYEGVHGDRRRYKDKKQGDCLHNPLCKKSYIISSKNAFEIPWNGPKRPYWPR